MPGRRVTESSTVWDSRSLPHLLRQVGHRAHPQQLALDILVQLILPPHRADLLPANFDLIQVELPNPNWPQKSTTIRARAAQRYYSQLQSGALLGRS
jgi:hypothetical protein